MKSLNAALLALLMIVAALCAGASAADPPAGKSAGSVAGTVTYGEPAPKITVKLIGPVKKTATTDERGQFSFEDLPSGDYTIECEGVAKNNKHKGSAAVTIPDPPAKVAAVTIKLQ